jgi:hypothetical protein
MALDNRTNLAVAVGVLLLAGAGAAAWVHNSRTGPEPAAAQGVSALYQPAAAAGDSDIDGYYPSVPAPVYIRETQPAAAEPEYTEPRGDVNYRAEPVRRRHHERSKKHSVEIVAGTAAAGAAIGAIAGGGSGAAIGAISGAGAGFAYDRLTHKR